LNWDDSVSKVTGSGQLGLGSQQGNHVQTSSASLPAFYI